MLGLLLQAALAAGIGWHVAGRVRVLCFEAPLPREPWWRAVEPRWACARERFEGLDRPGAPWIVRLVGAAARERERAEERLQAFEQELRRGRSVLPAAARAAHLLGALLAIVELASVVGLPRGVEGLQAGRLERIALRDALVAVAAGAVTAWWAASAHRLLQRQRRRLEADLQWMARRLWGEA